MGLASPRVPGFGRQAAFQFTDNFEVNYAAPGNAAGLSERVRL
jgi:hypothetical protein